MGCGTSCSEKDKQSETALKAALIIQNWYRGRRAQLKTRQRYALTIFQSIEYADEQSQLQLSNFFSFMLENYTRVLEEDSDQSKCAIKPELVTHLLGSNIQDKDRQDYLGLIDVPDSYCGPRLQFPLTFTDIDLLIEAFKQQQILHAYYVLEVLFETKKLLQQKPNFTHTKTSPSKEITICGDLHGKLDDLFLIFSKNGLPSVSNPYVFNGDFVDRGKNSMEILMILFVSFLVYPNDLHLNRGNHEDFMMNKRYGFTKEVLNKYKWKSVLMPPIPIDGDRATEKENKVGTTITARGIRTNGSLSEQLTKHEWEQVVDILWSDPRGKRGCYPNTSRGGGCYFGPDVTSRILNKYQLKMLIRSHECKPEGYEICHDGKVITLFSASNYYEEGSNRGAYIRVSSGTPPRFFQYQMTRATCLRPHYQRVNALESSAIRMLKERMISQKTDLIRVFQLQDCSKSGKLSVGQWAFSMENVLGLNLPWRSLSSRLVTIDKDGNIDYMSSFQDIHIQKPVKEAQYTLIETVYRYRSDLQIIFNVIDSDHSGLISMEEFRSMWKLFTSYYSVCIDDSQIDELAERMDLNKDGSIDFNEFLKAFYVVHKFDKLNKSDTKFA
ncbi:serine/threonine-protein phosphatase with EF-hands 1 isoform X5 [Balaenoptera acutorostrata]|uniref:Serine/threonine-protein phosphatase n=1 Tax=Balaenoptera acutorostrata TaxID=9767 RepID=A0ABM3SYG3_BALAC|nr:serine/threonine-protein phosphatase with EF-hands 1 isoform X5 [Balaenoptera acutorostrata]